MTQQSRSQPEMRSAVLNIEQHDISPSSPAPSRGDLRDVSMTFEGAPPARPPLTEDESLLLATAYRDGLRELAARTDEREKRG